MTTTAPQWTRAERREKRDRFVAEITSLCAAPGVRADLRSGLGRPLEKCGRMHRHLSWRVPENSFGERAHYTVAALIADRPRAVRHAQAAAATKPGSEDQQEGTAGTDEAPIYEAMVWERRANLGTSLARAVRAGMKEDSAESHLRLLARQSFTSVHPRLPSLLHHAQEKGADVDWAVLLDDLAGWDLDRDRIATRWLQSFYRTLHTQSPAAP